MTSEKVGLQGEAHKLPKRGLSEKTCQKYKIYRDGDYLRHYYYSKDGLLLGCKVKTKDKQFWYEGDSDGSFSASIYGLLQENESSSQKVNLMQLPAHKFNPRGLWLVYQRALRLPKGYSK